MSPNLKLLYIYNGDHKYEQEHEYTIIIYILPISIIQCRMREKVDLKWTVYFSH